MQLEKTCRNPKPTVLNRFGEGRLAQLEAPAYATNFEDLIDVLRS